ncbi:MAG TPA: hypothetical protein PLA94_29990 [Myxococcota bacterium]|nr:hypothetical protein [Myxococcota bacterium]
MLLLALLACSTQEPAPRPAAPVLPVVAPAVLVPPPAKVQESLQKAGIQADVQSIVGSKIIRPIGESNDETAVRTGVLLAQLVLTTRSAPRPESLARLTAVREGLSTLGAAPGLVESLEQLAAGLGNDAINESDRAMELERIAKVIVEQGYKSGPRTVPLLQAGGWLAGSNVVASAVLSSGKIDAASLLKQPEVAAYFLGFVRSEGQKADLPPVMAKVEATLQLLQSLAERPTIGTEELQQVQTYTNDLLGLL